MARHAGEGGQVTGLCVLPGRNACAGEFLGGRAVGVFEQRREVLRHVLILEAVDEIFGWELVGGQAAVAQKVAHGVVVLAVGQAAQHDSRTRGAGAGGLLIAVVHRLGQLVALELGEVVDPGSERGFLGTAGLDALSAGMRDAGGGLSEKQRIRGVLRIDQHDQRFSKGLDPVGGIALLGKLKAGGGRHAIGVVAAAASGFFEDGVDGFGKGAGSAAIGRRGRTYEYPDQQPAQSGPIISPSSCIGMTPGSRTARHVTRICVNRWYGWCTLAV